MFTPASRFDSSATISVQIYSLAVDGKPALGPRQKINKKKRSRKPSDSRRVLIYGRLLELALYRAEVLRGKGFTVVTPKSKAEAIAAIEDGEFDALVVSYTLTSDTAEEIVELARQKCPGCPVITISETGKADRRLRPDAVVQANDGPPGLIKALQNVFRAH
jgi:hypothetical protein